jgi:hypothetical protein
LLSLPLWLLACRVPEPRPSPAPSPPDLTGTSTTGTTGETGATGETGLVELEQDDCASLVSGPFDFLSTDRVRTEEDFDFDAQGYLITQHLADLAGFTRQGEAHVVAAGIGPDAAGIRSLVTGDIVVAQPDTGFLNRVDPLAGTVTPILGGLSSPNGLEAGLDGMIYSSEHISGGRVRMVDPYTGEAELLAELEYPNNMALSPDERTLYVVAGSYGGPSRVVALDRDDNGEWGDSPRMVYEHDQWLGGITTDKCGHVYIVEYSAGKVYRLRVEDPATPERIADLTSGSFSSLRFTPGTGDWAPSELFVTNRMALFSIDVQIAGRHVLAPQD